MTNPDKPHLKPLTFSVLVLAAVLLIAADADEHTSEGNPAFTGAGPHAQMFDAAVRVYPTTHQDRFYVFASGDLKHWQRHGPVLHFDDVGWLMTTIRTATSPGRRR